MEEIDGERLVEPLWLPYFKSLTLQQYKLEDGTNIFPEHPRTHTLEGKTATCKVYEDLMLLDVSGDVTEHYDPKSKQKGFGKLQYHTYLGTLYVLDG